MSNTLPFGLFVWCLVFCVCVCVRVWNQQIHLLGYCARCVKHCIVHPQVCGILLLLWLGSEQFWVTGEESSVYDGRWSRAPDQTQSGGGAVLLYPIQHGRLPDSPHQLFGRGGTWVTFDLSLNLVSHTQLSRMLKVDVCFSMCFLCSHTPQYLLVKYIWAEAHYGHTSGAVGLFLHAC